MSRQLSDAELEYRASPDERAAPIKVAGKLAWDQFLAEVAGDLIEPFPAVNPIEGDLSGVTGKLVRLPALGLDDWISEAGSRFLVAGDRGRGYYFVAERDPATRRVLAAAARYTELIGAELDPTYAIVGRIGSFPTMRVVGDEAVVGMPVEAIGVLVGGAMFVDTRIDDDGESPFAGQEILPAASLTVPPDDASPAQVLEAAFKALEANRRELWAELFAPWWLKIFGPGRIYFDPIYTLQRVNAGPWRITTRSAI